MSRTRQPTCSNADPQERKFQANQDAIFGHSWPLSYWGQNNLAPMTCLYGPGSFSMSLSNNITYRTRPKSPVKAEGSEEDFTWRSRDKYL